MTRHQYLNRGSQDVVTEKLFADRVIHFLYSETRENAPALFRAVTSAWTSSLLGFMNFDLPLAGKLLGSDRFFSRVDWADCLDNPTKFRTARDIFERKIRYWECRPMPLDDGAVTSPADAKTLVGSFQSESAIHLKGKFFDLNELFGPEKTLWRSTFDRADFAVFRLTPDKYHYNHTPVAGRVTDFYEIPGAHHSCNPGAVVELITPYSKNKRVLTIIDTDVEGGTQVGLVAMVEIVALMIGDIVQCYSEHRYENPTAAAPGMFVRKGCPKSLYRPGSSTDVLLFEPGRIEFAEDLVRNMRRPGTESRFSAAFGRPLVETDVAVRSLIATRRS